jgi:predicted AAA+ superfamily ATPase
MIYQRPFVDRLALRLQEPSPLIQVLVGPRQVGKTTGVKQLIARHEPNTHYASADDLWSSDRNWLIEQWQKALLLGERALLVIDEIQKVPNWPETIKALWDQQPGRLRMLLLGSSSLQIQKGVTESLAGRFELIRVFHWSYAELKEAFGYDLPRYIRFGGYPGAVAFEDDPDRWYAYIKDSIIEPVIGKDILQQHKVSNPALFRQAFEILLQYPAQEISYTKLLGQLQDKGNTDLIKHYIDLYTGAFLLYTLHKYSGKAWLRRASSPKMLPACPALFRMSSRIDPGYSGEVFGRLFELAVGVELARLPVDCSYWRDRNAEVDFIVSYQDRIYAIEVKSGRKKSTKGLDAFKKEFPKALRIIISPDTFDTFTTNPIQYLETVGV